MFARCRWLIVTCAVLAAGAIWPSDAAAQRRVVRGRPVVFVAARPYYPVFYHPFYSPWYGWHPYDFYWQRYPYPYYPYRYDNTGSARIQVRPKDAEVFIDGYFVGTVDDFDGWLQRLHVEAGEHEIELYHPQYRTIREKVLFRPGGTLKIEYEMEPLPQGKPAEPRPVPSEGARARPAPGRQDPYGPPPRRRGAPDGRESGAVAIRVQPLDAEVLIDGERWNAPEGDERLVVQLAEGEHRIEVRKEGYREFTTTIRVRRGETVPLNVSLTRQETD